jgi:hypothetical protein
VLEEEDLLLVVYYFLVRFERRRRVCNVTDLFGITSYIENTSVAHNKRVRVLINYLVLSLILSQTVERDCPRNSQYELKRAVVMLESLSYCLVDLPLFKK